MSPFDRNFPRDGIQSDAVTSGRKLASLWNAIIIRRDTLSEWEATVLDECFRAGAQDIVDFRSGFIESLRLALGGEDAMRYDMIAVLFEKAEKTPLLSLSEKVLEPETDILPTAVRTFFSRECRYIEQQPGNFDALFNAVKRLLRYGACINGTDLYGNTALYYACVHGNHELFQFLIESGANTSTLHHALSDYGPHWLKHKEGWWEVSAREKQTLFQATLTALLCCGSEAWSLDLGCRWGRIAVCLNDLGWSCSYDEPTLVPWFHIACFQGNMEFVGRLVRNFEQILYLSRSLTQEMAAKSLTCIDTRTKPATL